VGSDIIMSEYGIIRDEKGNVIKKIEITERKF